MMASISMLEKRFFIFGSAWQCQFTATYLEVYFINYSLHTKKPSSTISFSTHTSSNIKQSGFTPSTYLCNKCNSVVMQQEVAKQWMPLKSTRLPYIALHFVASANLFLRKNEFYLLSVNRQNQANCKLIFGEQSI